MQDHIRIQDRDIPFERTRLKVNDLTLDPANPRIQYLVGRQPGEITQQQLDDLLWGKDQVKALGMAIKQNGGVYDPLVIQRVDGKYIVREGNSRTVSTRHLAAQHPGDTRFETVPTMVFDETLTDDDLAVMLADMHVTGKIRWDAYEQAKHVHTLYNVHGKTYDWLATHLRLSKSRITQDLKAFGWTTDYLKQHPDPKNVEKFSFFQELARKKDLADRYTNDLQFKQLFNEWLSDGKLTDSKHVRQLETILGNPEATKVLGESGFNAAAGVLIKADPALGSDLYDALKRATEKLQKAPADEVLDLANNKQKVMMLRNLRTAVDNFATLAGVTL